ncbi:MAG TPA: hypothetical protein VI895_10515 [Bdellovibrionota bacterium]|nr:hypothetical protein [Bdellovibrionota bacterium]
MTFLQNTSDYRIATTGGHPRWESVISERTYASNPSNAVSQAASLINQEILVIGNSILFPMSRMEYQRAVNELDEIFEDCSEPGWDGYNALSIDTVSMGLARRFLERLPSHVRMPEVAPDPNGQITLEWRNDASDILVINFSPKHDLVYAAVLGSSSKFYGTEPFLFTISPALLRILDRYFARR